jgi:hypothetical protein
VVETGERDLEKRNCSEKSVRNQNRGERKEKKKKRKERKKGKRKKINAWLLRWFY